MNKLFIAFLSFIVIVLSVLIAIRLFIFSDSGNDTIKSYIQTSLEQKTGLPVDIYDFSLDENKIKFSLKINKEIDVDVITQYNILSQSFDGIYHIYSKKFNYKGFALRHADLRGRFTGASDDMQITGTGRVLDANLSYRLHMEESAFQHIEVQMKALNISEVFALLGEDSLLEGTVDMNVYLPHIGESSAKGHGKIILHKSFFNREKIAQKYDISLPKDSYVIGDIDMKLEGKELSCVSQLEGNLFSLRSDNASFNVSNRTFEAQYKMDVNNLNLFTQNKLRGAFKLEGKIEADKEKFHIMGASHSWGGILVFDKTDVFTLRFDNLALEKVLYATKQPSFAKGVLSGGINNFKDLKQGQYTLEIKEGTFIADVFKKQWGYEIPSMNDFTLASQGYIVKDFVEMKSILNSTLGDLDLAKGKYLLKDKSFSTSYALFLPNIGLLIHDNMAVKRGYIRANGEATLSEESRIVGKLEGLGGVVDFEYTPKDLNVEAPDLFIEKILSLSDLPRYVKGKVLTKVTMHDMKKREGKFSISSDDLMTQPRIIEKIIGKPIAIKMQMRAEGNVTKEKVRLSALFYNDMAKFSLDNMRIDRKNKTVKSEYLLDILELKNAYALTNRKLYGPMKIVGTLSKEKELEIIGYTHSLGGEISFLQREHDIVTDINTVSLDNIIALFGHDRWVNGDVRGNIEYNSKEKIGTVDLNISKFQIISNSSTKMLKTIIGKDPSRIIYRTTTLYAEIEKNIIEYTLLAEGSHSTIEIINGLIDRKSNTHRAYITFTYEDYEITGEIKGSIDHPTLSIDPTALLQSPLGEKIQDKVDKALGGFLKGFKF